MLYIEIKSKVILFCEMIRRIKSQHSLGGCSVVFLMGEIYEVHRRDGLRWCDIRTKFHKDWFGFSRNI
jgi:hypothetical protein